ncbi:radical SAM protein [Parasulfuritortus cantonensis]|uniref:Radical SAM protein n=1 Tax=Parasulfuritortus cantonensis TaxID=2528202 RepID=A0A4R1BGI1_9PROT|nr:radical SAM protein [Parasulfuritortus cantonensis]TCJ16336.1 radical SAM protein [Parasulfuritortus cantonensis]
MQLTTTDHDRDAVGLTYVYPVLSRRAGGVSIGINLNVNHACNWRCIYCQVPDLTNGGPPPVDLPRLETELRGMLADVLTGDFMARSVPEGLRRLNDIALSGNGEPTSAAEFAAVVDLVGRILDEFGLAGRLKVVLISNGSLMHRPAVQAGLRRLAELGGEVWFKIDRASVEGLRAINHTDSTPARVLRNLGHCASACPTWIQTCVFSVDGEPPAETELAAYLDLLGQALADGLALRGVMLYGLARPSTQPEAPRLGRLPEDWLTRLAGRLAALGLPVRLFP